ncbi:MAG: ChbG/HpnK family deacetylase [bacterium]
MNVLSKWFVNPILVLLAAAFFNPQASAETPQEQILKSLGCEKALIINGDDLGRSEYSNEGILKAFNEGILTSTSLMVPSLAAEEAYRVVKENPKMDVGVHFVLARDDVPGNLYGPLSPVGEVPSLVDEDGNFFTEIDTIIRKGKKKEMEIELEAQVKTALENGVDVTHLDCHKGFYHTYDPKSLKVTLMLAEKYDLPIRWQGQPGDGILAKAGIVVPDRLTGIKMDMPHEEKMEQLFAIIDELKPGITEIVMHPASGGYTDEEAGWRKSELAAVLSPELKKRIEDNGICLIGYRALRDFQRELRKKNKK